MCEKYTQSWHNKQGEKSIERCCECDVSTGNAGIHDGSLFTDKGGPFCQDCYDTEVKELIKKGECPEGCGKDTMKMGVDEEGFFHRCKYCDYTTYKWPDGLIVPDLLAEYERKKQNKLKHSDFGDSYNNFEHDSYHEYE